jgi:hypothetical protein
MTGSSNFSDSLLFSLQQLTAAGDEEAFEKIYYNFHRRLFLFARAIVKTKEAAEEFAEDVFVKIWQQKESLASIKDIRVNLYVATKNTALNYLFKPEQKPKAESRILNHHFKTRVGTRVFYITIGFYERWLLAGQINSFSQGNHPVTVDDRPVGIMFFCENKLSRW